MYNREKEREITMEKAMVFYVSDCCNVESDKDHEVCSRCGEHCEIIAEEYTHDDDGNDPTGGLDDEWDDGWRWD